MSENNIEKQWYDEKVPDDTMKWWSVIYDFDDMSVADVKKTTEAMPVKNVGGGDTPTGETGETFYVRNGVFRQATIEDITSSNVSAMNIECVDGEQSLKFVIEKVEQGDLEWEEYKNLYELCLVIAVPVGQNFEIQDAMGVSVKNEFEKIKTLVVSGVSFDILARMSKDEEFVPDIAKTFNYTIQ